MVVVDGQREQIESTRSVSSVDDGRQTETQEGRWRNGGKEWQKWREEYLRFWRVRLDCSRYLLDTARYGTSMIAF
jgi:hypothetical protein